MKVLIINGPNLNMLGLREPALYGETTYGELVRKMRKFCAGRGIKPSFYQSNCEGAIVGRIQKAKGRFDAIEINAGAYTHTSIAILDALKCAALPCAEVHITDIAAREEYRRFSYISEYAFTTVKGEGIDGYFTALDEIAAYLKIHD